MRPAQQGLPFICKRIPHSKVRVSLSTPAMARQPVAEYAESMQGLLVTHGILVLTPFNEYDYFWSLEYSALHL